MKDLGDLMKQAKVIQENMQKVQENIASIEVVGQSGAGMVKVTMTGRHDVKNIDIKHKENKRLDKNGCHKQQYCVSA